MIYEAILALNDRNDAIDPLTVSAELEKRGDLADRRRQAVRAPARGRRAGGRQRAPLRQDREGRGHAAAAARRGAQHRVARRRPARRGPPARRGLRAAAVRRRPRRVEPATSARSARSWTRRSTSSSSSRARGSRSPARRRGSRDLDDITGGFQKSQPDRARRAALDGQERARHEHRRERRAQAQPPGRAVLAGDVGHGAGAALRRQPGPDAGRQAAQGRRRPQRLAEGAEGLPGARARRRCGSTTPPTSTSSSCARRRAACTPRRSTRAAAGSAS